MDETNTPLLYPTDLASKWQITWSLLEWLVVPFEWGYRSDRSTLGQ